ncbi:hypothetical protein TURU_140966 [Turdus rufiventris]|nr:hypothetical protein TURU_140966 [Turdus rufiventris]
MLHLPELHERPVEDCGEGKFITSSVRMDFPATQPKPAADGKIIYYPPGVKEITDKITNDEVVKRLKGEVGYKGDFCEKMPEELIPGGSKDGRAAGQLWTGVIERLWWVSGIQPRSTYYKTQAGKSMVLFMYGLLLVVRRVSDVPFHSVEIDVIRSQLNVLSKNIG